MKPLPAATLSTLAIALSLAWALPGRSQSSTRAPTQTAPGRATSESTSPEVFSFGDVDLDGQLEVFVLHPNGRIAVIRNVGDGTLVDVTLALGLAQLPPSARILLQDVNGDAAPDLLVLARDGSGRLLQNELAQGFRDVTQESGLDLSAGLVEARWDDSDRPGHNGTPDLFLITRTSASLHQNLGGFLFEESSSTVFDHDAAPVPGALPFSQWIPAPTAGDETPASASGPLHEGPERPGRSILAEAGTESAGGRVPLTTGAASPPGALPSGTADGPASAAKMALAVCAETVVDQDSGLCIEASSVPALGSLYPISSDLFVDAGSGYVGINTTSPGAHLEVDAAGGVGLSVSSVVAGATPVQFTSLNTLPTKPTLFARVGDGGTAGYFQEKLSVGTLFAGLPSPRVTLGIDASDNGEMRVFGGGTETVELLANEIPGNGAQLDLRTAAGQSTITLDAETGASAAEVSMFDKLGKETVQIRSESSVIGTGGQLALRRTEGPNAIVMEAATSRGAELSMRNAAGIETIELISDEAGGGAQLRLTRDGGFPTIVMDAQQGSASQVSLYNSNAIETIEMVAEEGSGDGAQIILKKYDGTASITLDASQGVDGRITTETLQITGGADLVEAFEAPEDCTPGSVVVIDAARPGALALSRQAYDACVAGVVSGAGNVRAGLQLGQRDVLDGDTLVALSGRVYVRCTAENGPIAPGDLLTSSSTPGHAMRATDSGRAFGAVIGKAMGALEDESGLVLVLVGLQ